MSLQDPSAFYRKSIAEEAEIRIRAREATQKENLELQKKNAFTSANNILSEKSLQIQNEINAAIEGGKDLEEFKLTVLQQDYKLQIDSLQALDEAIKKQEQIIKKNENDVDVSNRAKETLRQLNELRDGYNRNLDLTNKKLKTQADFERKMAARQTSFGAGIQDGFQDIRRESDSFNYTFGQKIPTLFRDGMVGAMDAVINKTDDLSSALLEVAASFLRSIQSAFLQQAANQVVNMVGAAPIFQQKGGIIRAQNGMYITGGRTGDRNLALLEDGEYVLNRNAVKAMGGPSSLDSLNFGAFPRFANGGRTSGGERVLTPDVPLNPLISSSGANASGSVNLGAYSDKLSGYALENTIFIKEYFDQQRQLQEEAQRRREQRRALVRQIAVSALSSAVMGGIGYGFQAYKNRTPLKGGIDDNGLSSSNTGRVQTGGFIKFNSGGYLPYGNRLTDSIPALLTGGEYIINSRAVRKYGIGGLNRINNGVARFENGGMVDIGAGMNGGSSQTSSTATNDISINITVNNQSSGKSSDGEQTSSGGSKSENEKYTEFSKRVKEAVVQVIVQEQRSGGLLDTTKKRTQ